MSVDERKELLAFSHVKMYYPVKNTRGLFEEVHSLHAVDDVSFSVYKGETLGVVGESGCGKSTTGKLMVKLLTPTAGVITYEGKDINKLNRQENFQFKQKVQLVFQDPYSSLDPKFTVGRCIEEPLRIHKIGTPAERKERVLQLMQEVGLPAEAYSRHPHEFSGGQRQRIGIARALALRPDVQKKYQLFCVFISRTFAVVKHMCDRVLVMYLGNVVEISDRDSLFEKPLHPYSEALIGAIPVIGGDGEFSQDILEGDVPSPIDPPPGCPFAGRCKYASDRCRVEKPQLRRVSDTHAVACHLHDDITTPLE